MDSQGINYRTATIGVGGKATFHYLRQEKKGSTSVALVAPPEEPKRDQTDLEGAHPLSGVTVANLSPAVAEELSFDWESRGVVVVKVNSRGAGRRFGFQPGDIVLSINNDDIETVADLEDILSERKSRWSLSIKRGNRTLSMSVSG